MAIIINEQPEGDLQQIAGPSTFLVVIDDATSETLYPRLEADLYINGSFFHKYRLPTIGRVSLTSSVAIFTFALDVSGALQAYFSSHSDRLPSYGSADPLLGLGAKVKLEFFEWKNDGTGLLSRMPISAETSTFFYAPAMLWPEDPPNLQFKVPYYSGPPGTTLSHVFLTDKPTESLICKDQSEFIGVFTRNANRIVIESFNESGASIGTATISLQSNTDDDLAVAAIGPKDLESATFEYGTNPVVAGAAYYEVYPGSGFGSSFSFQSGLRRRYYLSDCDCKIQICFLNKYGVYDTVTVFGQQFETLSTSSSTYQTGFSLLDSTVQTKRRGANRSRATGVRGFSIVADNLDADTSLWLQQLAMSPDIYRMDRGYYESIRVTDQKYTPLDRSRSGLESMQFSFEYGQKIFSHSA